MPLLGLLLALPFFWRLDAEEFHGDESHWISSGQQAFYLLTVGRLTDPQWREEFYLYSQPQVGKVAIGAALAGSGIAGPTPIYDYDWQRRPWENQAVGRVPAPRAVLAGRLAGAAAGWLACLALWGLAVELGAAGAGRLGAALLASHPLWLANARRAGLDAPSLALGLIAVWIAARALKQTQRPSSGHSLRLLVLAGVALGLGAGAKYVALLTLPVLIVPFAATLLAARRRRRGQRSEGVPPVGAPPRGVFPAGMLVASAGLALLVAGATFWATNPTLYPDPWRGLQASVGFLTWQAGEMRQRSPVFQSPPLVALEIVDRAFWPTRYPPVIDLTLPEPLVPGSYGTPVVALGALMAVIPLLASPFRRWAVPEGERRSPGALLAAGTWVAAVGLALTVTIPIWWERWHLPLIPPLCLLAGLGLARLSQLSRVASRPLPLGALLVTAQYVAALAMGPSYLGHGFGALIGTPAGALAHLLALALTLAVLVVHFPPIPTLGGPTPRSARSAGDSNGRQQHRRAHPPRRHHRHRRHRQRGPYPRLPAHPRGGALRRL